MSKPKSNNSPLLGYNTNVKHAGKLFHIQTEDSGRDHPHIITHLFTDGTILATKKQTYSKLLDAPDWENLVRQLMKDQHKAMFVELRDGDHDAIASRIFGEPIGSMVEGAAAEPEAVLIADPDAPGTDDLARESGVRVIRPAEMAPRGSVTPAASVAARGRSVFETPDVSGTFGESLISDKSLDEVILTYLKDELDE
ncbi:MAG TPA: hypothetical protein VM285_09630 [Polyangia bacterium]|nr:hypothetical protein [Polyangia bacterium]